jgi:proteic killer suppression protein
MIKSFKHRGLKRLYERSDRSGIRPDLLETVERILTALDAATTPQAMSLPGIACIHSKANGREHGL